MTTPTTHSEVRKERLHSDSSLTTTESFERYIPTPPDGGWGWVVVGASLFCNIIVDGIGFSFGVFLLEFTEYFQESKSKVSLVGSLLCGMYLFAGPIVSALTNKLGCRLVAVIGSVVASAAFLLSLMAPSIDVLIVTYGVMGGFGLGMLYLPSIVIVGYYFEKKRALATGIAVCGSGIGTFIFSPLSEYLLQELDWKNALMVISGITLNGAVFGMLMRPLEPTSKKHRPRAKNLLDRIKEQAKGTRNRTPAQQTTSHAEHIENANTNTRFSETVDTSPEEKQRPKVDLELGFLQSFLWERQQNPQRKPLRDLNVHTRSVSDHKIASTYVRKPIGNIPKNITRDDSELSSVYPIALVTVHPTRNLTELKTTPHNDDEDSLVICNSTSKNSELKTACEEVTSCIIPQITQNSTVENTSLDEDILLSPRSTSHITGNDSGLKTLCEIDTSGIPHSKPGPNAQHDEEIVSLYRYTEQNKSERKTPQDEETQVIDSAQSTGDNSDCSATLQTQSDCKKSGDGGKEGGRGIPKNLKPSLMDDIKSEDISLRDIGPRMNALESETERSRSDYVPSPASSPPSFANCPAVVAQGDRSHGGLTARTLNHSAITTLKKSFSEAQAPQRKTTLVNLGSEKNIRRLKTVGSKAAVGQSLLSLSVSKKDLARPLYRKDIFYSGSVANIPQFRSQPDMKSYITSITTIPGEVAIGAGGQSKICRYICLHQSCKDTLLNMLDLSPLKYPPFLLVCLGNLLAVMGLFVPFIFSVDLAHGMGIPRNKAALLISFTGITNTLGRVVTGWLADLKRIDNLTISYISLFVCGISAAVFPFCNTYTLLCVAASVFGLGVAAFASLSSILICDLIGLEKLTNGFGLMSLCRGIAAMTGPPLAGFVHDRTGSYDASFYLWGALLTAGGLCHLAVKLPCVRKTGATGLVESVSEPPAGARKRSHLTWSSCR